ncbi:BTAD domain-containing putative transcriptional regulator [Mycobacteroides chelonae]|uniref:BTAD domain-containing putative transcriptional regulator n=1 Tax=Mycobacteroides chelonae TaxID=1774 RepID=UPI0009922093|nr:BTAD domain-containing putative transcriptional regulator [Mycobacteroides chelonae]
MVGYFLSGGIQARVDSCVPSLGGPKQRCVLAVLLASHGTVVSIDRLADAIWADDPPAKSVASLRSYVANLRRVLTAATEPGGPRFESRQHGYQLNVLPGDTVDLHQFEQLVNDGRSALIRGEARSAADTLGAALALWRGDPFGEFTHHDFAHADTQRYVALRTTAIEARFDAVLQAGDSGACIPEIEEALAQEPLHERLWGHLMLALYRTGRTTEAIRAFDRARMILEREIGTRPGEGLQTLYRQISRDAPELKLSLAAGRPITVTGPRPGKRESLVGRDAELSAIADAVAGTRDGSGSLVLLAGESGIGKTALAQDVSEQARADGLATAWATHPMGIRLPVLWTWIQILRQLGRALGPSVRERVVRAAPGVVDALVPEWNDTGAPAPQARAAASGFQLVEGLVTALTELSSDRALLLVLDDVQRADPASCNALILLQEQLPWLPIQVIGNWTYFGSDRPVNRSSFERVVRSRATTTIHLDGMDLDGTAGLVEILTGAAPSSANANLIWEHTGGNPLYITEFVRVLDAKNRSQGTSVADGVTVPDAISAAVGRRLSVLDTACRHTLSVAGVVGPMFDVAALSDIVDLPVSVVQRRLRPAYETGLLDELPGSPGVYRFSHGLVRDAVLAHMTGADRMNAHAAIARSQSVGIVTMAYEEAIATADHAWRAGVEINPHTALEIHESVVQRAVDRSAYEDITVLCDHAIAICRRLPPKPELLGRQATLWLHLAGARGIREGHSSEPALDAVQRAFELGSASSGRNFYGAIVLQIMMLCARGRLDEAQVMAKGLDDRHAATGDSDIGEASHFVRMMIHGLRGEFEDALSTAKSMFATFPAPVTVADPLHFLHPRAYCFVAVAEANRGDREAALRNCQRSLDLARSHGDVFNVLAAKLTLVEVDAILGIHDGIAGEADAIYTEMVAAGAHQWAGCARLVSLWARTLSTGEDLVAEAFEALDAISYDGSTVMMPFWLCLMADIEKQHKRVQHARDLLTRAHSIARATGEHAWDDQIARRLAG